MKNDWNGWNKNLGRSYTCHTLATDEYYFSVHWHSLRGDLFSIPQVDIFDLMGGVTYPTDKEFVEDLGVDLKDLTPNDWAMIKLNVKPRQNGHRYKDEFGGG
jgi:hypothetical protein